MSEIKDGVIYGPLESSGYRRMLFIDGITTAFDRIGEAASRAVPEIQRFVDRYEEVEYRRRFGHAPPGSWRTRRLAKKRRKAMNEALGGWEVPS